MQGLALVLAGTNRTHTAAPQSKINPYRLPRPMPNRPQGRDHRMIKRRDWLLATLCPWPLDRALAQTPGPVAAGTDTRLVIGFPPGGTVDALTRRLAEQLRSRLGQPVRVDNKVGAGGRLAVDDVRRAAPDGRSWLITPASMLTLYPHIYPKLSYTPDDLVPVAGLARVGFGFCVGPRVPENVRTLKDFLAWVPGNNAPVNYGSPGAGSPPHLLAALLEKEADVPLTHVAYRGAAPGLQDLLAGQIAAFSGPLGDFLPHVANGRLRVLATSGAQRSPFLPQVPTFVEQGFANLQQTEWYGCFMPASTPVERVAQAAALVRQATATPGLADTLAGMGIELAAMDTAELAAAMRSEHLAWGPLVKRLGFTADS